jgi:tetratricopeptide (TPR) repeat protein
MFAMRNKLICQLIAIALIATLAIAPGYAQEESERDRRDNQKTKQAQAVSKEVYESIQKAQELVDAKDLNGALRIVERLYDPEKLTNYEQANVLNYLGFIHYSLDNIPAAMSTYQKMIKGPELEPQLLKQTTYTLAQLYTMQEDYNRALSMLDDWFKLEENPQPEPYILKAQNLYQLQRYGEIVEPVETAMTVAREKGKEVKEEWYSLLNFAYFQLENYKKVRDIQKILLNNWPKKNYWFSLAGAFTELGEDRNLIKAYDSAYTQGMLEKEAEFVTMAQLYLQAEVPYKAATVLEEKMKAGVVTETEKNYRLLSQALMLAMEDEKAIPALTKAAALAEDGELDIRLGNSYLNIGDYSGCARAVRRGLDKGDLKNPDYAYISLGMCLYNLREYSDAKNAFREAGKTDRSRRTSSQWITVIDADVERNRQIAEAERAARRKAEEVEKRRQEVNRI